MEVKDPGTQEDVLETSSVAQCYCWLWESDWRS